MPVIYLSEKRDVSILLTSTIRINPSVHWLAQRDSEERKNIYLKSIKQWLENTSLDICLVENSGYTFPELDEYKEKYKERFDIISYDEKTLPESHHLKTSTSKGQCELFALNYAFNHSKRLGSSKFVIKITGRYYIPGLEQFLSEVDYTNKYALQQNNSARCEMVGAHRDYFKTIFNPRMTTPDGNTFMPHMESYIQYQMGHSLKEHNRITCPVFPIEETIGGGEKQTFDTI